MVNSVASPVQNINLQNNKQAVKKQKQHESSDVLLSYNPIASLGRATENVINAFTIYPAKGITGNRNSDFYEFLTMGMVPYTIGSLMLISVFNSASKHFSTFSKSKASKIGKKIAFGVLFYGLFKEISKTFISMPLFLKTGININQPYKRVIHELPEHKLDTHVINHQNHKVYESVDFPRWDLLYSDSKKGGDNRNTYYDKIAKKMGLGEKLNDSDQEAKPHIREALVKARTVQTLSSYLWAAVGVALAVQTPVERFLNYKVHRTWNDFNFKEFLRDTKNILKESVKELYTGVEKGMYRKGPAVAGKLLIFGAILSTVLGNIVILTNGNKQNKKNIPATSLIDRSKETVVC